MLSTVAPSLGNYNSIDALLEPANPVEDTPTGESLEAVANELDAFDEPGPKAIVLATDGEPDTCAVPDPQEGQPEALAAAEYAFDLGIQTFVISVGDEVGADHLQQLANLGVGKPIDAGNPAPYYQALNPDELVEAFSDIVGTFVNCIFTIEGEVDLEQACAGSVEIDGEPLVCDEDYRLIDESTLELIGDACERLKDGNPHDVSASFPCGSVTNIP